DKKNPEFDQEKFDDFVQKTNFDGGFGRVLCIGYAVDDEAPKNFYNENNEKETLRQFWELVSAISVEPRNSQYPDYGVQFVGHNVMDFDLRFIYQRSIVLGVRPSYEINFARYRNYPVYDTMKEWVKWANSSVGLDYLAYALDVPSSKTGGVDGSQVADFFTQGKVDEILEYCKRDVETTRAIYRRMTFEKPQNKLF
ncbi:MAG: hypothetical protein US82_C0038G0001, partial [Parcubacteria group bacterium GW2011_GWC1_38_22]